MSINYTNYLLNMQASMPAPARPALASFAKGFIETAAPSIDSIQQIRGNAFDQRIQSMLNANPPLNETDYDQFVNGVENSLTISSKANSYITSSVSSLKTGKDTYIANQQTRIKDDQTNFVANYVWSGLQSGTFGAAATIESVVRNVPAHIRETEQFKLAEAKMRANVPLLEQIQTTKERQSLYNNEIKIAENRWGLIMQLSPPNTEEEYDAVFANVWGSMSEEIKTTPAYQFLSSDLIKNRDLYLAKIRGGVDKRFLQGQQAAAVASLKSDLEGASPATISDADAVIERSAREIPDDIKTAPDPALQDALAAENDSSDDLFESAHNLLNTGVPTIIRKLFNKVVSDDGDISQKDLMQDLGGTKKWDGMSREERKKAVSNVEEFLERNKLSSRTSVSKEETDLYDFYTSTKGVARTDKGDNVFLNASKILAFEQWVDDQGGEGMARTMMNVSAMPFSETLGEQLLEVSEDFPQELTERVARAVEAVRSTLPTGSEENFLETADDLSSVNNELRIHLASNGVISPQLRNDIANKLTPILKKERAHLMETARQASIIHAYHEVVQGQVAHLLETPSNDSSETNRTLVEIVNDAGDLLNELPEELRIASVRAAQTTVLDAGFKTMNNSISIRKYIDEKQFGMSSAGLVEALERYHDLRIKEMNGDSPVLRDQKNTTSGLAQSGTTVTALDDNNTALARRLAESSGLRFMSTDESNEARILSPTREWQDVVDAHISSMALANKDLVLFSRSIGAGIKELQYFNFEQPLNTQLLERMRGKDKLQQMFPKENLSILSQAEDAAFKEVYNTLNAPARDNIVSDAYEQLDNLESISVDNLRSIFGANDVAAVALNDTMLQRDFLSNRAPDASLEKYNSGTIGDTVRRMLGGSSYALGYEYFQSIENTLTLALAAQGTLPTGLIFKNDTEIFDARRLEVMRNIQNTLTKRFDVVQGVGRSNLLVAGGRAAEVMDNIRDQIDSMQLVAMDRGKLINYYDAASDIKNKRTFPYIWTKVRGIGKSQSKALSDNDYQIRQISPDYGQVELRDPSSDIFQSVLDAQGNAVIVGFYDKLK